MFFLYLAAASLLTQVTLGVELYMRIIKSLQLKENNYEKNIQSASLLSSR